MNQNQSRSEMIALFRYGIVAGLLSVTAGSGNLKKEIVKLSQKTWRHPETSGLVKLSFSAIEHWYYDFCKLGFPSLMPKKRKDKGICRSLPVALQDEITRRKKANPSLSAVEIIRGLLEENKIIPGQVSMATIYRFMQQSGLKDFSGKEQKERRAFEASFPGQLWQSDLMYGPYLTEGRRKRRTYLYCFIDDCSRVIPHAQFYFSESLFSLVDCFKQAILKRGIPYKVYTDNGKVYLSHFFNLICANLGIKLLHCEPFDPAAKGKIERFIRTLRGQFLATLDVSKIKTIEELNAALLAWIEGRYHLQKHSSLNCSPLERWLKNSSKVRMVKDPANIDSLFLARANRRVTQDGCVSILGKRFEVNASLVGKKVELRYDPFRLEKVLVYFEGKFIQQALLLDLKLNASLPRRGRKKGDD